MTGNRTKTVTIAITLAMVAALCTVLLARGGERPAPRQGAPAGAEDLLAEVTAYTARFGPDTGYRRPSRADRDTVARAVGLVLDGRHDRAERLLTGMDFTVRTVVDAAGGRRYTELADRTDDGPAPRGWGRVYVAEDGTPAGRRWVVQVPHPVADRNTERVGVGVLRGTPGGILLLAGAHRKAGTGDAADVAHRRDTVFDAVAAALTARSLPALQVHGFADDSAPGRDVVASTGRGRAAVAEGRRLADALRAARLDVCRGWARRCPLEGRTNVQGRLAAAHHVPFLHVELSNRVRTDEALTARAVRAFGRVTEGWHGAR
jgi:hypothetical protein